MLEQELVRRITAIERRLDSLVKPEVGGWRLIPNPVALAAPAASVTFANLPQIYRTLVLLMQVRTDAVAEADVTLWRANGDAGANYDYVYGRLSADGTQGSTGATASIQGLIGYTEAANSRASNFSPCVAYFPGYALATQEKWCATSIHTKMGDVSALADLAVGIASSRWRSTAAITSLTIFPSTGPNFVAGSRFALYGIL